jgi:hypothetical protein
MLSDWIKILFSIEEIKIFFFKPEPQMVIYKESQYKNISNDSNQTKTTSLQLIIKLLKDLEELNIFLVS